MSALISAIINTLSTNRSSRAPLLFVFLMTLLVSYALLYAIGLTPELNYKEPSVLIAEDTSEGRNGGEDRCYRRVRGEQPRSRG